MNQGEDVVAVHCTACYNLLLITDHQAASVVVDQKSFKNSSKKSFKTALSTIGSTVVSSRYLTITDFSSIYFTRIVFIWMTVWYGIVRFNVIFGTQQVISETIFRASHVTCKKTGLPKPKQSLAKQIQTQPSEVVVVVISGIQL